MIIELTGNVHFETFMIAFLLLAFLYLLKNKWQVSSVFSGLGIATKLMPILFLPLAIKKLGWKKGIVYAATTGLITFVLFATIINVDTVKHLLKSIDLFFRNFEFNASLYYLIRWIGETITGYDIIANAGPILSILALLIILFISFREKNKSWESFLISGLFIICIWYFFATTVHPWYVCLPVALSVFTPYRFPIIWSFTAALSYAAYQFSPAKENLLLIGLGYVFVIAYGIWEIIKAKRAIGPL